ncbi:TonB-dependent hemoglobin/transferrin/lactoferrin family receptor [Algihabitans albus]|uniref:TonB-dependent hemoglobin/transferrin/lactoferrin family receptor n=1 Tax=Algihabitans albus TaxID=2164067 RepID=UPI000E5D57D6|nr:TonB-dependent hemoglobin/transferrin/lactoferrin family receptor [Algihabitans albus]
MMKTLWGVAPLSLAAATVMWSETASAQDANEMAPMTQENLEVGRPEGDGALRMNTISVTATRNAIDPFVYPGMVTVIDREELQRLQPSTPDDVLKLVPNVEFTGGPRRTGEVPSIRGFSGPDVVLLVDGARQNFGSAHDGRFFIDPSLLRSVEVLRGPASALYGSGGTGGVIEFRTVTPDDFLAPGETFGARVGAGVQSVNEELLGTFTAYGKPLEGLELLGSVTHRDSGDIELGDGDRLDNTDDSILSGLVKGGFEFGDHHRVEASYTRFANDAEEPNNGQGLGGDDVVDKEIRSDNVRLAYSFDDPGNRWIDLDVTGYYTAFQADELRLDDNGAGPSGELLKRDVDTLGFRLDNRSRFRLTDGAEVTLTYGTEVYRDDQNGAAGDGERDGVPDAEAFFTGVFGQAEFNLAEPFGLPGDLLILPGLRFDRYEASSDLADDETTESRLSPRIGVSYLPQEWLLFFANYAEAFRAPTFDELYLTGTHFRLGPSITNRFVPNPDLKPQTTQTVEFGAGLTFDEIAFPRDTFSIKATHFRIWGEDFIDQSVNQPTPGVDCIPAIPGDCDGTTRATNVPEAELWGSEVEASYENDRILLGFGFSMIDGENEDTGEKLNTLTPNTYTFNTGIKLPEIDSLIGWRAVIAQEFDEVNDESERRQPYDVHDFYFAYQPSDGLLEGFRLDLGIDNAFDEEYARVFTNANEAGRNFKAAVSYSLNW